MRTLHLKWAHWAIQNRWPAAILHGSGSAVFIDINDVYLWLCSVEAAPVGIGTGSDSTMGSMTVMDHVFWLQGCHVLWKAYISAFGLCLTEDFHTQWFHREKKFSSTYSSGSENDMGWKWHMQMIAVEELLSQDYKHLFCEDGLRVLTKIIRADAVPQTTLAN